MTFANPRKQTNFLGTLLPDYTIHHNKVMSTVFGTDAILSTRQSCADWSQNVTKVSKLYQFWNSVTIDYANPSGEKYDRDLAEEKLVVPYTRYNRIYTYEKKRDAYLLFLSKRKVLDEQVSPKQRIWEMSCPPRFTMEQTELRSGHGSWHLFRRGLFKTEEETSIASIVVFSNFGTGVFV